MEYVSTHAPRGGVVVGVQDGGDRTWLSAGASGRQGVELGAETDFEIGSLSKSLVGLSIAVLVEEGLLQWNTTVDELWPERLDNSMHVPDIDGTELAAVTVAELVTHTSGIPRLRLSPLRLARTVVRIDNPYAGLTSADVLRDAAAVELSGRGEFAYSNLGFALVGELVRLRVTQSRQDRSDDTDLGASTDSRSVPSNEPGIDDLVTQAVLEPLRLGAVQVSDRSFGRAEMPQGFTANGRRAPPWTFDGYAAAGALVTSPRVLLEIALALMTKPGEFQAAVEPRAPAGEERSAGAGWIIDTTPEGYSLVWHNGGTGGFSSFLAFIPERQLAVVVNANSAVSVDALAHAIIFGDNDLPEPDSAPLFMIITPIGLGIVYLVGFAELFLRQPRSLVSQLARLVAVGAIAYFIPRTVPAALYHPGLAPGLIVLGLCAAVFGILRFHPIPAFSPSKTQDP